MRRAFKSMFGPRWTKIAGACVLLVCTLMLVWLMLPKPDVLPQTPYSSLILDTHGELLDLSLNPQDKYRLPIALHEISEHAITATLLYEDQDFYQHYGFDVSALIRAFWLTYIVGERKVGASTITMQVARLRWQIPSHSISGKLTQIFRAVQLSRHYSKQQILQAYYTLAPYGGNIEGIAAASWVYFNKAPSELSAVEAVYLAVVPQNPNKRQPSSLSGQQAGAAARERLLQRWIQSQAPSAAGLQQYAGIISGQIKARKREEIPQHAPHYTRMLRQKLSLTTVMYEQGENLSLATHTTRSTLDLGLQHLLEKRAQQYLARVRPTGIANLAAVLLNYKNMQIEAMLGSADFYDQVIQGQVNGSLAPRSPGSALKPFIYALAMQDGLIHPSSMLKDLPARYGGFTPENYDQGYLGALSARQALIKSRNIPAVELQQRLGQHSLYELLKNTGLNGLQSKSHYGLALALGGIELTMLELVELYAMLANGGKYNKIDHSLMAGEKLSKPLAAKQLLSPEASYLTLSMLADNPPPSTLSSAVAGLWAKPDIAWKTGTSWAFRDAWAIGVSGDRVLAIWVGNFSGKGNPAFIGRTAAGPLLFDIFAALHRQHGAPNQSVWKLEDSVDIASLRLKKVPICQSTGDLYEQDCPLQIWDWFIPGVSPIQRSDIYRKLKIDSHSGKRVCPGWQGDTVEKVYAFWPSDYRALFARAGVVFEQAPALHPSCQLESVNAGTAPSISSLQQGLWYHSEFLPLQAAADADVRQLYWFTSQGLIGTTSPQEVLHWQAPRGQYQLKVVDDAGRSSSIMLSVK